jgi:mannosyltransferase
MLNVAYRNWPETEPDVPIENKLASDLQLIVPNLHRRYSGVTATNRMVAPKLATMYRAAWLGPHAPDGIARMGFADLLKLWRTYAADLARAAQ